MSNSSVINCGWRRQNAAYWNTWNGSWHYLCCSCTFLAPTVFVLGMYCATKRIYLYCSPKNIAHRVLTVYSWWISIFIYPIRYLCMKLLDRWRTIIYIRWIIDNYIAILSPSLWKNDHTVPCLVLERFTASNSMYLLRFVCFFNSIFYLLIVSKACLN